MNQSKRPVIFWAWKERPSFAMRGIQVAKALSAKGYDTQIRFGPSRKVLKDIRNSIIVCIKSCPRFSGWIIRNGNKIVYDAIDYSRFRGVPRNAEVIIAGSDYLKKELQNKVSRRVNIVTIYHHADPALKPNRAGDQELRLVYIGEKESSKFISGQIPELHLVSFGKNANWRDEIRNYNAHFSARLDPRKSVIKLANVAALEGIFLTGAEPGCIELLGKDYPFYLRDPRDLTKVKEDVQKLKESVGSTLWKEAKERIQSNRARLTIDATVKSYEELLSSLS